MSVTSGGCYQKYTDFTMGSNLNCVRRPWLSPSTSEVLKSPVHKKRNKSSQTRKPPSKINPWLKFAIEFVEKEQTENSMLLQNLDNVVQGLEKKYNYKSSKLIEDMNIFDFTRSVRTFDEKLVDNAPKDERPFIKHFLATKNEPLNIVPVNIFKDYTPMQPQVLLMPQQPMTQQAICQKLQQHLGQLMHRHIIKQYPLLQQLMPQRPIQKQSMQQQPMPQRPIQKQSMPQRPIQKQSMPQRPIQKQSMQQQPMQQQSMHQQSMQQQSLHQRQMQQQSMHQQSMQQQSIMHQQSMQQQSMPQWPIQKQSMHQRPMHQESMQQQSLHQRQMQQQSMHQQSMQQQSIMHQQSMQQQSIHQRPMQQQSMHQQPMQHHSMHQRPIQQYSMHQGPMYQWGMQQQPMQHPSMQLQSLHQRPMQQQPMQQQPISISVNIPQQLQQFNQNYQFNQLSTIVTIGPNGTSILRSIYDDINWTSVSVATRKLLTVIFGYEVLGTHSLTGKPSPAFRGRERPPKNQLDPLIVADIIYAVTARCGVTERKVRQVITTKCADSTKILKQRRKKFGHFGF